MVVGLLASEVGAACGSLSSPVLKLTWTTLQSVAPHQLLQQSDSKRRTGLARYPNSCCAAPLAKPTRTTTCQTALGKPPSNTTLPSSKPIGERVIEWHGRFLNKQINKENHYVC